jgi:integral membrane sensor domain MASE1
MPAMLALIPLLPPSRPTSLWRAVALGSLMALVYFVLALASLAIGHREVGAEGVWLANGALLGVLLRRPAGPGPGIIGGCAVAALAAYHLDGAPSALAAWLALANMTTVFWFTLLAWLMRALPISLASRGRDLAMVAAGAVVAPLSGGLIATTAFHLLNDVPFLTMLLSWWLRDACGIIIMLPPILFWRRHAMAEVISATSLALAALLVMVALMALESSLALYLLILPLLATAVLVGPFGPAAHGLLASACLIIVALLAEADLPGPWPAIRTAALANALDALAVALLAAIVIGTVVERRRPSNSAKPINRRPVVG